ncbi:hypothetical protein K435DRAFT_876593 [Dendrothele bispora CBS 962.96]|uniref:F-box domain-containing protein n=1 Tax=Dendrothele bispora (strain CBS 962.96) TaxID=1314807 RepID=A0A4S8KRR3_DENBC|nr:hypothetical protein K435DRAFT_876593 [Dendrothele bispora CBS 962.96]
MSSWQTVHFDQLELAGIGEPVHFHGGPYESAPTQLAPPAPIMACVVPLPRKAEGILLHHDATNTSLFTPPNGDSGFFVEGATTHSLHRTDRGFVGGDAVQGNISGYAPSGPPSPYGPVAIGGPHTSSSMGADVSGVQYANTDGHKRKGSPQSSVRVKEPRVDNAFAGGNGEDRGENIPPEILLLIMKELRDSTLSLETAALVCRAWRGPAQVYLFSQIHIRKSQDCSRLSKIFQKSPHIASLVNRLVIQELDVREISGPMKDRTSISKVSYTQSRDAINIASILGSSVRELGISVYPLHKNNLEFLKQMKRVQTLKVEHCDEIPVDILIELIQGMRNLTSLHFFGGENDPNAEEYENDRLQFSADITATANGASSAVDMSLFRLTRLTLDRTEHRLGLLKFLLDSRHFDLGALKDLDFTWMQAEDQSGIATLDYTFLDRLLRKVGNNLHSLTLGLHFSGSRYSFCDQYLEHYTMNPVASPLQSLVTLESFSIVDRGYNLFDPHVCSALLNSIPSSSLTRIHFKTLIDVDDFTELTPASFVEPEEDPGRDWKAVDILLRHEDRFPVLTTVTITIVLEFDSEICVKEMQLDDTQSEAVTQDYTLIVLAVFFSAAAAVFRLRYPCLTLSGLKEFVDKLDDIVHRFTEEGGSIGHFRIDVSSLRRNIDDIEYERNNNIFLWSSVHRYLRSSLNTPGRLSSVMTRRESYKSSYWCES